METFFKRYFWTVQLVAAVLSAVFLAAGTTRFLLARTAALSVATPPEGMGPRLPATDEGPRFVDDLDPDAIPTPEPPRPPDLCEGVTCGDGERCNATTGACEPDVDDDEDTSVDVEAPCPDTDLTIQLAGTMVSDDPAWSVAVLRNPTTNNTEFVRIGDMMLAQATVVRIERNRVFLSRSGRTECLRPESIRQAAAARGNQPGRAAPARPAARPAAREQAAQPDVAEVARSGVERVSPSEFNVRRDALDAVLNNQAALREQAPQIQPAYTDGRPSGFRLQGVQPDSIFSQIGIRNGDVIQSVNGQTIDSPARAMELYQRLQQQGRVELTVDRRGRQQTLVYNIQ